jgi:RNA polymerase sigma-70 factor, ECF subfamily
VQPEQFREVLRLARGGDEAAFTQLFRDTQPVVLRYLRSLAAPDLVDDVASDTWVSVIKSMDTFRDDDVSGFRAWVLTIARRRWVDEVRRRSRRREMPDSFESAPERPSASNVEGEVQQRLGSDAAIALIRRLPADQAEVVTLRAIAGLSVEEVAQIVGKKPGTVRVLSHRGLRKLAELLGDGVTEILPASIEEVT